MPRHYWIRRVAVGLSALSCFTRVARSAPGDWAEGTPGRADGASRDYYNRAARLEWRNRLGDWRDAKGVAQGNAPYATAKLTDDDTPRYVEWDVTGLVGKWVRRELPNKGMFLRGIEGSGKFDLRTREWTDAAQRPRLIVTAGGRTQTLTPQADTHTEPSTYRSLGNADTLRLSMNTNHVLLRFDLSRLAKAARITKATLRLYTHAQYGGRSMAVGVFRCDQGHDLPPCDPAVGLAAKYPADKGIEKDTDVVFFDGFESERWADGWSFARGTIDVVAADPARRFQPFAGKALRVKIAKGANGALNLGYKFKQKIGREPEEIFFRYYLRLGQDWNQTVEGGKMPGISGTYGRAGWGGRRTYGKKGWSARGSFFQTIPPGNPLAGRHPIGTYCYHADQKGTYGDTWIWSKGYRGYLTSNRWYCIEQYLKMNTPGKTDGILKAWVDGRLAFEKTDIRFRHVTHLKIEQIWMNVYHGGRKPSPHDQHLFIDNVVIAKKYIGPVTPSRPGRT